MKMLKMLSMTLLVCLLSCKSFIPSKVELPPEPEKLPVVKIETWKDAGDQIADLTVQEFTWRLWALDVYWVLGFVSDKEREAEKTRLFKLIDSLETKE